MILLQVAWERFWHADVDPRVVALFRIAFGLVLFVMFASQYPWVEFYWGESGVLPWRYAQRTVHPHVPSVFNVLPKTDAVIWVAWTLACVQALLLTVGWKSRFQAASMFVWLSSFQARHLALTDGGDPLSRLMAFFMIFLPLGATCSVDAWRRRRSGRPVPPPSSRWALRFIQIEVVLVLLVAGIEKLPGSMWRSGTAMFFVMQLDDFFFNHPVPEMLRGSLFASRVLTWSALAMEFVAPITIWFRPTRRPTLAIVIGFHLALAWMMNIFVFEYVMIAGWLTFVRWDEDVAWLRGLGARLGWVPLSGDADGNRSDTGASSGSDGAHRGD